MTSNVHYKGHLRTVSEHLKSGSKIESDAPTDNHGKGERFSPTDMTANSLASCMITVMAIRAEKSDIPFQHVDATVKKVMASDPRRIAEIHVEIQVGDTWNEKQKQIMEKTARECPVALSLHPDLKQYLSLIYLADQV